MRNEECDGVCLHSEIICTGRDDKLVYKLAYNGITH